MNKIYTVKRFGDIDYDEFDGFVVMAKSPKEAKAICADMAADEGREVWLVAKATLMGTASKTYAYSKATVILSSFNAG